MEPGKALRTILVAGLALAPAIPALATGNCVNGKALYAAPVSGLSCASNSCHKADPSSGANKIQNGANNPTKIANAINGGVAEMAIFKGKFTASDLDDLATWIADAPTCPASGAAIITVAPASFTFAAAQNVGSTSASTTITVSNTGTASATGLSIANSNGAEFPATNTCAATLANGASCTISASFSPTAAGSRSATLTVNSSAGATTVSLSGTGNVVAPGVLSMPAPFAFAAQTVGVAGPPNVFSLSNTGGTAVTISSVASSNAAEFAISGSTCAGSVAAGGSCTFSVTFTPSGAGARSASITVTSTGTGSPQAIAVSGTGTSVASPGVLSVPASFAFGTQTVGVAGAPQAFTLTNTGGTDVTISAITSSNPAEFAISSSSCSGVIASGASCSISVTFTASAAGARSASITVLSTGTGSPQMLALTGTGTSVPTPGALTLPAAYAFADQTVALASAAKSFTLANTGGAAVTIAGVASSNAAEFAISASTCAGDVVPGGTCSFAVTFTPSATGARSSAITVTSNGVGSPQTIAVSGNGVTTSAPPPPPPGSTVDVVEYYYPPFDHYFMTTGVVELTALDVGTFAGWVRTGFQFKAYALGTPGVNTVCRFFSAAFAPKSSHFYTNLAYECDLAKTYPAWTFEGEVFNIPSAAADGTCPAATVPVYRLYNNGQGDAPNHRYLTMAAVRDQMLAAGWVLEGNLPGLAFMCAPQ
jgi:mono/diheme cytochrome c family protein